jgi:hypothetical protein
MWKVMQSCSHARRVATQHSVHFPSVGEAVNLVVLVQANVKLFFLLLSLARSGSPST